MAGVTPPTTTALDRDSLDTTAARAAQPVDAPAADAWDSVEVRRIRLRVRTLVSLRWLVMMGLVLLLLTMGLGLRFQAPYALCFAIIGAAAWLNLLTSLALPGQRMFTDAEATGQLALDIGLISLTGYLTGGTANPFLLLLVAPVTLAAATLPLQPVLALCGMAAAATVFLAFFHWPLPALEGALNMTFTEYRIGAGIAVISGIAVVAGYVRQAAAEAARMALALDVTQAVLSREQRLSALGGLAAAAAHELGTPLATISIVAKEMIREAPTPTVKEDAELLMAQAERCREILRRLTDRPDAATDEVHERLSLRQLVQEVMESHPETKDVRVEAIVAGGSGVAAPSIRRMPEIAHAFTSFLENAIDFAASEVLLTARFDADSISMEVRDDGPGFAPEVLARLGEPYVTTRPGAEGSRTGHIGMGLGFFISKTLLERSGAVVTFHNGRPRGAIVAARWPRSRLEVEAL